MPRAKRRSGGKGRKLDRPCTYDMGYVRQDLYACTKCTAAANGQLSGFCRGCREACHADHLDAVFELYTKRDFRCDCGNTRAKNTCILCPAKDDLNVGNERSYSHNFEGRYCRCDREYDYKLAMAQCAMCEDWFHEDCYKTDAVQRRGGKADAAELEMEYELTCKDCVKKLPVLAEYYEFQNAWATSLRPLPKPGKNAECTRPKNANIAIKPGAIDYLWRPGFRVHLCRCRACTALYESARASYIIDRGDFVGAPAQEDLGLLNATDDAEILNDVLEEKEAERRKGVRDKAMKDQERIPRKPLPRAGPSDAIDPAAEISPEEVMFIRNRIKAFIQDCIQSNGSNLNPDSMRGYLSDLKVEMMSSFAEKLQS